MESTHEGVLLLPNLLYCEATYFCICALSEYLMAACYES